MAARSKPDSDALWELVKRVAGLETKVNELIMAKKFSTRRRSYFLNQIKKLRVEKQGLRNYIKELEIFNKLPIK